MDTTSTATPTVGRPARPWWLTLIGGILAFGIGTVLLWSPAKTKIEAWQLLVVTLGVYWLIAGILDIVSIFIDHTAWGWKLFMGVISILAGGYILVYPTASALALPRIFALVLGIWGFVYGIMLFILAFRGGGWAAAILGVLGAIFGLILILNYSTPGMGLTLIWLTGVVALVGGTVAFIRAIQERTMA